MNWYFRAEFENLISFLSVGIEISRKLEKDTVPSNIDLISLVHSSFRVIKGNYENQICIYHSYFNNCKVWGFPKCSGKQRIFLSLKCFLSKEFLRGGKICFWLEMNGVRNDHSVGLGGKNTRIWIYFFLYWEFNLHIGWKILFKITKKVSKFKFLTFK